MVMLHQPSTYRTFVKSMQDRKEEKDAQAFRDDVEYFLSKEEFNLFDFHERVMVSISNQLNPPLIDFSILSNYSMALKVNQP